MLGTIASRLANEDHQNTIVRWSRLRANNTIGGDDGSVWLESTKWTLIHLAFPSWFTHSVLSNFLVDPRAC